MTRRSTRQVPARFRAAQMAAVRALTTGSPPPIPAQASPAPARRSRGLRTARGSDQKRLAELKAKLGDEDYMNGAILRIATVLSARLTLN
jgi:hypothetical protein